MDVGTWVIIATFVLIPPMVGGYIGYLIWERRKTVALKEARLRHAREARSSRTPSTSSFINWKEDWE